MQTENWVLRENQCPMGEQRFGCSEKELFEVAALGNSNRRQVEAGTAQTKTGPNFAVRAWNVQDRDKRSRRHAWISQRAYVIRGGVIYYLPIYFL